VQGARPRLIRLPATCTDTFSLRIAAVATSKPDNGIPNWQRSISVFIPALNEEHNLEPTVARLIEALTVTVEDYEIIIVDDGSSDHPSGSPPIGMSREVPTLRVRCRRPLQHGLWRKSVDRDRNPVRYFCEYCLYSRLHQEFQRSSKTIRGERSVPGKTA
jgi:cellulose synthase/poly-beta-1,6-N-acetylglucosamine synthase-like glycosyltransferase